jgi:hypothetical protein
VHLCWHILCYLRSNRGILIPEPGPHSELRHSHGRSTRTLTVTPPLYFLVSCSWTSMLLLLFPDRKHILFLNLDRKSSDGALRVHQVVWSGSHESAGNKIATCLQQQQGRPVQRLHTEKQQRLDTSQIPRLGSQWPGKILERRDAGRGGAGEASGGRASCGAGRSAVDEGAGGSIVGDWGRKPGGTVEDKRKERRRQIVF